MGNLSISKSKVIYNIEIMKRLWRDFSFRCYQLSHISRMRKILDFRRKLYGIVFGTRFSIICTILFFSNFKIKLICDHGINDVK